MALLDILRERTAHKGRTAQVDCGKLGVLTVEALPVAECTRYQDDRSLLYAACRELQSAGETLRQEGTVFRPDEILEYFTDEEAAAAANAVRALSGVTEEGSAPTESAFNTGEGLSSEREDRVNSPSVPAALPQETSAADSLPPQLMQSASDEPVFPRFSPQQENVPNRPALLQVAETSAPVSPVLQESAEPSAGTSVHFYHTDRQARPSHSPQTENSLAEAAAEILARELRRAALVR